MFSPLRMFRSPLFIAAAALALAGNGLAPSRGVSETAAKVAHAAPADRPNVVWIMSEDSSKHYFKHFDTGGTPTPHIEALAAQGITFDRAFSNSPVCSVARTTLITACYAPRIGTQFHRPTKRADMPDGLKMFPAYLRDAGYYTTNRHKEDYNVVPRPESDGDVADHSAPWDDSSRTASWQNRPRESMPFFHVQTITLSHESSLHFEPSVMDTPTVTDPESVQLPPYFPDTPTFRFTRARYRDRIAAVDQAVGKIVRELKEAGQLDSTFVFYFGDHGGVLPRSKGYLFESGVHVPLVVRVPQRFRRLASRDIPSRTEGFVEFVDFGPTVLRLAAAEVPEQVDGTAFLGKGIDPSEVDRRDEAFGYADRFDEKADLVRGLRQGKWKYLRNFQPHLPHGLQNNYRYKMLAYQQWRRLHAAGKLTPVQSRFFQPKPAEALYDLDADPHEIPNLASLPEHAATLQGMRHRLTARLKAMPDLSFMTEAALYENAMDDPVAFGENHQQMISHLIDVANLSLQPLEQAEAQLRTALRSDEPLVRYWALVVCSGFGQQAAELQPLARQCLAAPEPLVAAQAAEFLAILGAEDPRPTIYQALRRVSNPAEALQILNTAVLINDFLGDRWPIDPDQIRFSAADASTIKTRDVENRLAYLRGET